MNILLIDNNDSFTYNLVDVLQKFAQVEVQSSVGFDVEYAQHFDKIIFSPGPGLPSEQPALFHILEKYSTTKPILGICLGMQAICMYYGGSLYNLPQVVHGQTRTLKLLAPSKLFANHHAPINVGLYHSWAVDAETLPDSLEAVAVSDDGVLMAIQHKTHPVFGLQFHPESHITPWGEEIIKNFLS